MPGVRETARVQVMADIRRVALEHLRSEGAAGLSLRAVARDLGLVSSALYRYVPSRDALLTLLVRDGYDALGTVAETVEQSTRRKPLPQRWRAVTRAVREWALANPAEYALLYGTPVPGYAAPPETIAAARRMPDVLGALLAEGERAGAASPPPRSAAVRRDLAAFRAESGLPVEDGLLAQGLVAWAAIFGVLSFELFGHWEGTVAAHPAEWFDEAMSRLLPDPLR